MSETSKHLLDVFPHLIGDNGIDVGCGDDPVKPNCIAVDLPTAEYHKYNGTPSTKANLRAFADDLPFKDHTLDWVYSSHLLEDFSLDEWPRIIGEWRRVLRPHGTLVILLPERNRWLKALAAGQPPNDAHKHEPEYGELTKLAPGWGLTPITERQVGEYSILFVALKS